MHQPIVEVRERKAVLVMGIIVTLFFGGIGIVTLAMFLEEGDIAAGIMMLVIYAMLAFIGVFCILAYAFHRLKVYPNNQLTYSTSFGKKREFAFRDIAKISGFDRKGIVSMVLYDKEGKKLARVESNMAGYDSLCDWLNATKKAADEAKATLDGMGMEAQSSFVTEPFSVQGTGKGARVFMAVMGLIMLGVGVMAGVSGLSEMSADTEDDTAAIWFDPYSYTAVKQVVSFKMITYPFATFELSDAQGMYFIFDEEMYPYIICMENDRLETEFTEIYEYTFSDSLAVPETGELEGYAMEIDDELKEIAIEEFNLLWGEEIITEENFEDYFGSYYLDSTYTPAKEGESPIAALFAGIFCIALGIYLFYYAVKGYQKYTKSKAAVPGSNTQTSTVTMSEPGEVTRTTPNIIISVLATLVGAALGGILWMFFYKMGRIAAIAGYLAVFGAMWAWTKFGRRELKTMSTIWCIFVGVAMIVLANYLSYAWEIADALNETSPGRAEFTKVLASMPQLMTEWELWGSFVSDLAVGLVLALVAGFGSLFGRKKK